MPTKMDRNIDCALIFVMFRKSTPSMLSSGVSKRKETTAVMMHCSTFVSSLSANDFAMEMTTINPPTANVALFTYNNFDCHTNAFSVPKTIVIKSVTWVIGKKAMIKKIEAIKVKGMYANMASLTEVR